MTKAKRWKPKEGEEYWFVTWDGRSVIQRTWFDTDTDDVYYRLGNCFKTKREAQAVARKLKGFWKSVMEGKV